MFIENLTVKNFRNYSNTDISFSPRINFIIGNNGSGKTNILEAISILANMKSFRNINDGDIIKWGASSYYCSLQVQETRYNRFEIGCGYQNDKIRRKVKIDNCEIKSVSDYYGRLLTVIFSPVDINIINGTPELRRRFIDSVIAKVDLSYINSLNEFKRTLVSRNTILKKIKDGIITDYSQLDIWDDLLAEKSSKIIETRENFIDKFHKRFVESYGYISDEETDLNIYYKPSFDTSNKDEINSILKSKRRRDISIGSTGSGPQRDDYILKNNDGQLFVNYASQGQRRTAAISLRVVENEIVEQHRGEKGIILVDDIFSELDTKRRKNMIEMIQRGNQVLFTMVHSDLIKNDDFPDMKLFQVDPPGIVNELNT